VIYFPPTTISTVDLRRAALVAREMSYSQVARVEFVSTETIRSTMKRLRTKLGKHTTVGVVLELKRLNLLVWDREREYLEPNKELYNGRG